MAIIYILNTHNLNPDLSLYNNIPYKRLEKIKKSKNITYIKESLGAQLLLNDILENKYFLNLDNIEYIYNEQGKPYLKNIPLYFSITHSNGIVAVTVSKYEEVGIDIEKIEKHNPSVAKKIMTEDEYKLYEKIKSYGVEQNHYFYEVWTSKEAYVKKLGTTITLNPSSIEIDEDVVLKQIEIGKDLYCLAACGIDSFSIIEYHIPKEYKEKK